MLSLLLFRSLSSEMSIRIFGLPTGGQNPLCASNKKGPKGPFLFTEISLEMLSVYLAAVFFDLPASDTVRSFFTFSRVDLPKPGTLARSSTDLNGVFRSEEHTYELQSLMRISFAVDCCKKKIINTA